MLGGQQKKFEGKKVEAFLGVSLVAPPCVLRLVCGHPFGFLYLFQTFQIIAATGFLSMLYLWDYIPNRINSPRSTPENAVLLAMSELLSAFPSWCGLVFSGCLVRCGCFRVQRAFLNLCLD